MLGLLSMHILWDLPYFVMDLQCKQHREFDFGIAHLFNSSASYLIRKKSKKFHENNKVPGVEVVLCVGLCVSDLGDIVTPLYQLVTDDSKKTTG
jgi:hypothetical protein